MGLIKGCIMVLKRLLSFVQKTAIYGERTEKDIEAILVKNNFFIFLLLTLARKWARRINSGLF